jgi:hypothetical protein
MLVMFDTDLVGIYIFTLGFAKIPWFYRFVRL